MPLSAYQSAVASDPVTQFIQAIAQNEASQNEDLILPGSNPSWFLKGFLIQAYLNLAYELWVFNSATNLGGTIETQKVLGIWQFGVLTSGSPGMPVTPVGGTVQTMYVQYVDGNMIPYIDRDAQAGTDGARAKLHMRLINRSASGKTAGEAGSLIVTAYVAPQGQQV